MKLLFDQNLSHRLLGLLADVLSECAHVRDFSLQRADDAAIWDFARQHGYTIVSKDDDFHQRSFLYGAPPKVIWLRVGNCSTDRVAALLRSRLPEIHVFLDDRDAAFLALS